MEQNTEQAGAPAVTPEQAADLAALRAGAAEQAGAALAMEAEPAGPDLAQELTGLVLAFVGIAKPLLPSLETIYTPEVTAAAAGAVAAVCKKHGWLPGGMMGEYGEEIAAAVVVLPLAFATVRGVRGDLEAANRKANEGKPALEAAKREAEAGPQQWGQLTPQPAQGVPVENG